MSSPALRPPLRFPLAALVCLAALLVPASRAAAEPGIRILNQLRTQDLAFNTLTTNRAALQALTTGPLNSEAFASDSRLKHQLEDPSARNVMGYLVSCALAPKTPTVPGGSPPPSVRWLDRTGQPHDFFGSAGLCPEWEYGPPSQQCLGYVTACLLARNNAHGHTVSLSLRGEDPRNDRRFNPDGLSEAWGSPFLSCPNGGLGLTPDCGWLAEGVGTCSPGTTVTVGAGARDSTCSRMLGAIDGDRVLRVCKEAQGCTWANRLADADRNVCGGIAPAVTFPCPTSGLYSVMSAPYNRSVPPGSWVRPEASTGTFPASPPGAFTYREGAFYGNLFDPDALAVEVLLEQTPNGFTRRLSNPFFKGTVYQNAHACHSRDWVAGATQLTHRLCANSTVGTESPHGCVARKAGPCEPGSTDTTRVPRCSVNDGPKVRGDGDFEGCKDDAGFSHPEPITVFLRSPCDALSPAQAQVCTTVCGSTHCTTTCRAKSAGECLTTDACVRDPASCNVQ
ncbi:MAG TPA: hypothetical protein VE153_06385 [Myxococcus sp.]|nr:hypothetical protein [Myxococcus sp.]